MRQQRYGNLGYGASSAYWSSTYIETVQVISHAGLAKCCVAQHFIQSRGVTAAACTLSATRQAQVCARGIAHVSGGFCLWRSRMGHQNENGASMFELGLGLGAVTAAGKHATHPTVRRRFSRACASFGSSTDLHLRWSVRMHVYCLDEPWDL